MDFKVNVDGAVCATQKEAGVAVIIMDAQGLVIGALRKKIKAPLGAIEVEVKAYEAGVQFAKDMGIQEFILEGDSLTISNSLAEHSLAPSVVAPILDGIVSSLQEVYCVVLSHVRRQGNRPVHLLAKHVLALMIFLYGLKSILIS
ncbi:uncharacterized protein LOC126700876 [Quercus robur]|uniref:uncharacterized protein LOC126700876 n=1 Tax=Quercus robur TaxID=38942 RepID=UPI002161DACA|nr:uncharacterized protein LOC126700876 [Quercus robur]